MTSIKEVEGFFLLMLCSAQLSFTFHIYNRCVAVRRRQNNLLSLFQSLTYNPYMETHTPRLAFILETKESLFFPTFILIQQNYTKLYIHFSIHMYIIMHKWKTNFVNLTKWKIIKWNGHFFKSLNGKIYEKHLLNVTRTK